MDLGHLGFIKFDTLLFSPTHNCSQLISLIKNQTHVLEESRCFGLQLNLTQLIKTIDLFFSAQGITELVLLSHDKFQVEQLSLIQTKTTYFRVLIQCQKFYANSYWLNKETNCALETRMLCSLLRIYLFLQKVWQFFVGEHLNIKARMKQSTLILPLQKLQPFINEIYSILQRIQSFYYINEVANILEIHILLKAFKELLIEFPTITETKKEFQLVNIILQQNEKYKKTCGEMFLMVTETPRKKGQTMFDMKQKTQERRSSVDDQKMWVNRFKTGYKIKNKKHSYQYTKVQFPQNIPCTPQNKKFRPIRIGREKHISQTSMQSTNISSNLSSPSIRNISESKQKLEESQFSAKYIPSPRSTMSPLRIKKTTSRRTVIIPQILKKVQEQKPNLFTTQFQNISKQKQPHHYTLQNHHGQFQYESGQTLCIQQQRIQILGNSYSKTVDEIEYQISKLYSQSVTQITLKKRKYERYCEFQQIQF